MRSNKSRCQFVTGTNDPRSHGKEINVRLPKRLLLPSVPDVGSQLRGEILVCRRFWRVANDLTFLTRETQRTLVHNVEISETSEGWRWSIPSKHCVGLAPTKKEAKIQGLECLL